MAIDDIKDIIDWLQDGARAALQSEEVLDQLCNRLSERGLPFHRVGVFVRTLHPDVFGRSFIWRPGAGVTTGVAGFDLLDTDNYRTSPLVAVFETGTQVRHHIAAGIEVDRTAFLRDLKAEGGTDYIAFPLLFTDGSVHAMSCSTTHPGGFTERHLEILNAIVPPLARVAEIRALRRTASNLLSTYVGNRAGERIMAGQIRRGHTDTMHAVIWLSDMRGFTALSDRVSPEVVVDVLNRYFDCQVPAILKHGGEVLKFMGDGLLAIFPIDKDHDDIAKVCGRVLTAAREARTNVAGLNEGRSRWSSDFLRFGVALHIGQVLYGNIGGGDRLDFTCIGPAVNLAARLEKLAGKLGRTVLASAAFAQHDLPEWEHAGEFTVSGFASLQTVFGLRDEAVPQAAPVERLVKQA